MRSQYGDTYKNQETTKIEKMDYCLRKAELDLEFFVRCRDNNVISRFLNSHLPNQSEIFLYICTMSIKFTI